MRKISCLIVDDEPLSIQLLESYIKKVPYLHLESKLFNAPEALEYLDSNYVDLIFLDIQMPDMDGIDFSKCIKPPTRVIFSTAFEEYALESYKVDALGYLLKPYDFNEFITVVEKAREWFNLTEYKQQFTDGKNQNYIFVKSEYKHVKINLDEVNYFEGMKDYIKIYLVDHEKPILTIMSLKALEEKLPENKFMRIHRSYIISLDKIKSIERSQVIIDNKRITIADQYKERFNSFISGKSIL